MSEQQETPISQENTNGDTAPPPAPASVPTAQSQSTPVETPDETGGEPVVRMRNAPASNGQAATINGHAAVQRGLELLAESEAIQSNEEIKKLDSQLDHFNKYLDKFEKKNSELTNRLSTLLTSQKEERIKRRASFMQKEEELKAEQDRFDSQLRNMFAKCAQMRRTSAPVTSETGAGNMIEQSRRIREGSDQEPIKETNGHEETETNGH